MDLERLALKQDIEYDQVQVGITIKLGLQQLSSAMEVTRVGQKHCSEFREICFVFEIKKLAKALLSEFDCFKLLIVDECSIEDL